MPKKHDPKKRREKMDTSMSMKKKKKKRKEKYIYIAMPSYYPNKGERDS